jgi:hypothetical protein
LANGVLTGDTSAQIDDINPGFGPKVSDFDTGNGYGTRVFWVAKVPDSDLTVDPAAGTAELKVTDLAEYDYNNFPDSDSTDWHYDQSAAHPHGFYNATVSFDIKWTGPVAETDQVKDTANGFAGTFYQNDATTTWDVSSDRHAGTGHFTFTADPSNTAISNTLVPGVAFVQLAREQNGVFFPSGSALQPDPINPALTDLVVDGSSTGGVRIQVQKVHGGRDIRVKIDGAHQAYQADFATAAISHLIVNGGPGDNRIEVGNDVGLPALLLGSFGKDHIEGGGGRTIIIGGLGSDHLRAGSGDAILIAGTTVYDRNFPALDAILDEWARKDESHVQRVANLSDATVKGVAPNGLGLNEGDFLNASTVHNDGAGNVLVGGPRRDWFFAKLDGVGKDGVRDQIRRRKPGGRWLERARHARHAKHERSIGRRPLMEACCHWCSAEVIGESPDRPESVVAAMLRSFPHQIFVRSMRSMMAPDRPPRWITPRRRHPHMPSVTRRPPFTTVC